MPGLRASDLLAVTVPPGPSWPDILREAWEAGAAVLPVDDRLPEPEAKALLAAARPTVVQQADQERTRLSTGVPVEDGVALVVATSGSAGKPKLAELTHDALRAAIATSGACIGATAADPWLCCLPVAHMGGMLVLLRGVLGGAQVTVLPRFDLAAFELEREARFTSLVPTMLARLLDSGVDLARFRAVLIGGSGFPELLASAAGTRVVATYGLTETCGGCVYDGVPLDGTQVRIGEEGEVLLRGPTLMNGYRLEPAVTAAPFDPGGWLRTRDAGELTGGRLRVFGRLDDVIGTGGEKVWPEEVEGVLRSHARIADVAVAARLDPEWGQRVVAFVVPADPGSPPNLAEIRDHVAGSLARYKAPREVVVVAVLPRSSSGKVLRRLLDPTPG